MIVDIIEEIIAESAHVLLSHDGLVEDPRENVADDGAGVVHRPLHTHQLVHLLLADLGPVPTTDGCPTYEASLSLHLQADERSIFYFQRNLGIGDRENIIRQKYVRFYVTIYLDSLRGQDGRKPGEVWFGAN